MSSTIGSFEQRGVIYTLESHDGYSVSQMKIRGNVQAPVVQTLDSAI